MSIATQRTSLYVRKPSGTPSIVEVGCPTSISGAGSSTESIETTCLNADTREYVPGLSTPGEVQFDVNFDTSDSSHMLLETLKQNRVTTSWGIGFSDGNTAPTYASNKLTFSNRSSITFKGFISSLEFDFSQNNVVTASIGIQVTGPVDISKKA